MPLMSLESFGRTPPFHFRGKEIKSMKKIVLFSGICAIIYSVIKIKTIAQIWVLPAVFLGFCFLFSLLYWLFLGLFSLHIRLGKNYDKPSKVDYCLLNSGYKFLCSAARIKLHVTGMEKIPKEGRFLLVSNHLSRFDPMIQSMVLKDWMLAFISKPSNFTIPIGRRYIKRSCYMPIDRENPRNALKTINHATDLITSDTMSVAVYPEGHRGTGARLQEFKHGCLKIAVKADCPIVVATIYGTQDIHRNFPLHRTDVYFDILDVIEPGNEKTALLSQHIKEEMQGQLNQFTDGG